MRLHMARALVAKDMHIRDESLRELEKIVTSQDLSDDARMLLDRIGRTTEDSNLSAIVKAVNHYLDGEKNVENHKFSTR
jgi:hypothetical protein